MKLDGLVHDIHGNHRHLAAPGHVIFLRHYMRTLCHSQAVWVSKELLDGQQGILVEYIADIPSEDSFRPNMAVGIGT